MVPRARKTRNGTSHNGKFSEYGRRFDFGNFGTPAFPMTWGVQNCKNFDWASVVREISTFNFSKFSHFGFNDTVCLTIDSESVLQSGLCGCGNENC
jgi:hypothetical protein